MGNLNKEARGNALRVNRSHPMKTMVDAPRMTTHLTPLASLAADVVSARLNKAAAPTEHMTGMAKAATVTAPAMAGCARQRQLSDVGSPTTHPPRVRRHP
jgi:hypothetical protein